jgi:PAS domain S-box-containing protein
MNEPAVRKADRLDAIERPDEQKTHAGVPDPSSVVRPPSSGSQATTLLTRATDREPLYIAAVEPAGFALHTRDTADVIVAWNPAAQQLFGYGAEEAIGRNADMLVPEDRRDDLRLIGDKLRRGERIDHLPTVRLRKDGRRIDVVLSISPIREDFGGLAGQFVIALGVTEQRIAEERLRLTVELFPSGVIVTDAAGTIVVVNKETEKLFGYLRGELIGQPVDILVPLRFRGMHSHQRHDFTVHQRTRAMGNGRELFGLRKDGTELPVEIGLSSIPTRDGMMALSVIVDISERKRNERLKDEFVATVSHELRTPLTSIAGSLGLLVASAAGKLPDNVARLLMIAHKNSQRLVRLINDILDIEKIESGKVVFDLRPVGIRALVEQAIEVNRGFAEAYDVRLRLDPDAATGEVCVDADRLVQVITNLLSNAIKFSPAGEDVVVRIDNRESVVRVSVRDHGRGIPDEFKPRMFEKFAQADASDARQKGGTGLGLSIVKQIVTRLGGEVGFADAYGGGTIFYVELPWFRRAAEQLEQAAADPHVARLPKGHDGDDAVIVTEVA